MRIEGMENQDWGSVYAAVLYAINKNSGIGFHNGDQGYHTYAGGAKEMARTAELDKDGPESNGLYQFLKALSPTCGGHAGPRVDSWKDFCLLSYNAYLRATGGAELS